MSGTLTSRWKGRKLMASTVLGSAKPEPDYSGVVPPRMSFITDWREYGGTLELYFDVADEVGYLLWVAKTNLDSHIATFHRSGDALSIAWRGAATDWPEVWRESQQGHMAAALTNRSRASR